MAAIGGNNPHMYTPFGIRPADETLPGLVSGTFNLLEAPDATAADVVLAHFLYQTLKRGARAALVSFDNPHWRLAQFAGYGFDFTAALEDDRLTCLYYRPTLSRYLGFGAEYGALFGELRRLAGPVERVGFLNPEVMFNLESDSLAAESISRFVASAGKLGGTALGVYVPNGSEQHARLHAAGSRLFAGAFALRHGASARGHDYVLESVKGAQPCNAVKLILQEGRGYVAGPTGVPSCA